MISKEEIKNSMDMAKLELSEVEIEELQGELSRILTYVNNIKDIDVDKVGPKYTNTDHNQILRKDVVSESLNVKDVLSNTDEKLYGFFKLLNIME